MGEKKVHGWNIALTDPEFVRHHRAESSVMVKSSTLFTKSNGENELESSV